MAKALTGRITQNLVAGIVITVVTVLATVSWMAHKHNEQAAVSTETMVAGGLQAMGRRLAQLANDYGWWEEAYDAYVRKDDEWIEANVGTGITDTDIADLLIFISPDGVVDHEWITEETEDGGGFDMPGLVSGGEGDDLFAKAVQVVLRDKKASTSYVQRRLSIGYNRAASIIERMEQEGVVGRANHAGKREILVPDREEAGYN